MTGWNAQKQTRSPPGITRIRDPLSAAQAHGADPRGSLFWSRIVHEHRGMNLKLTSWHWSPGAFWAPCSSVLARRRGFCRVSWKRSGHRRPGPPRNPPTRRPGRSSTDLQQKEKSYRAVLVRSKVTFTQPIPRTADRILDNLESLFI